MPRARRRASSRARRQAAIFSESGGNPFYALQLARAARQPARSSSADRMAVDAGVPRTVAAALVEELDALSARARRLLDAGSIAGDPFEPELACEIARAAAGRGDGRRSTSCSTRACCIRPPCRGASPSATRSCAARSTSPPAAAGGSSRTPARRARLAARGASAAARAHHVEQSAVAGRRGGDRAAARGRRGDRAARPAAAARWFGAALRLMPEADAAARLRTLAASRRCCARPATSTAASPRCSRRSTASRPARPACA